MKVSVVVPAFNEERLLAGSLAAIRQAMSVFPDAELIVCDNNSTDTTPDIARAAGATVVFEPVNQIARARNRGAAAASGDWLVFVDADSYPTRELFADALAAMRTGTCLAGGSTIACPPPVPALARFWLAFWNMLSRRACWAAGSFIFCETRAFRDLGGFSQEFFAGEEIELFGRLKRRARAHGRGIVILARHPLMTSDRKLRLYTQGEQVWFMLKALLLAGRPLRDRNACYTWYDGRR